MTTKTSRQIQILVSRKRQRTWARSAIPPQDVPVREEEAPPAQDWAWVSNSCPQKVLYQDTLEKNFCQPRCHRESPAWPQEGYQIPVGEGARHQPVEWVQGNDVPDGLHNLSCQGLAREKSSMEHGVLGPVGLWWGGTVALGSPSHLFLAKDGLRDPGAEPEFTSHGDTEPTEQILKPTLPPYTILILE